MLIAGALVVLTMLLTSGSRMSPGVWMFLLVAVYFGGWKAVELVQKNLAQR